MSNPLVHAERSAKKWGGTPDLYLPIHRWFDATKSVIPDNRYRMLLHNSFGILLAEQVFGPAIQLDNGRRVFVRDIGTLHILEDLGFVPTPAQCLADLPLSPWMAGAAKLMQPPEVVDNPASQGDVDDSLSSVDFRTPERSRCPNELTTMSISLRSSASSWKTWPPIRRRAPSKLPVVIR